MSAIMVEFKAGDHGADAGDHGDKSRKLVLRVAESVQG